jgi:hypothetical protein
MLNAWLNQGTARELAAALVGLPCFLGAPERSLDARRRALEVSIAKLRAGRSQVPSLGLALGLERVAKIPTWSWYEGRIQLRLRE